MLAPSRLGRSSFRRTLIAALAPVLALTCFPADSLAYEGDHYSWTYYIALHVGYTRRQAFQVASGAYAIDWDPDTGPMEAKPGDAIYGARHPGITGTSHPEIARIWTDFHAFAEENYIDLPDLVEKTRQGNKDKLWLLAKAQRNPGPLMHFTQDYHSHFAFDSVRGHAVLGHKPDFFATDPDFKTHDMTRDTVAALQRFLREVLGGTPKEPPYQRFWEIIDRIAKSDPAPALVNPMNFNPFSSDGAPSLYKSISAVNRAIAEDEASGLLPKFPEVWFSTSLPGKWYQYQYDNRANVNDRLYPVEQAKFEPGKEEVTVTPVDANNFTVKVRLPYKLTGLLDLQDGDGVPFLSPLPVYEKLEMSDARVNALVNRQDRKNGDYALELTMQRSRRELEAGVTANLLVNAYGFDPVTRVVTIPVPADTKQADDCKALIARAQQLLKSGDIEQGTRLMEQARRDCSNVSSSAVKDLISKAEKDLEQEQQKVADQGDAQVKKCEYEGALATIESLKKANPNHPWVVSEYDQIKPQAEGQKKAREFLRLGQIAILAKDIDLAIDMLRKARDVTYVPQCMLDDINKLLKELELRKDFMKQTEEAEKASTKCDYKEAARIIGDISRIRPREQYITDWLNINVPKIGELQDREKKALALINQADGVAAQAEAEAKRTPVDTAKVAALAQQAMDLLKQADKEAPKCSSERVKMEAIRLRLEKLAGQKTSNIQTSILLLIDTSGSMRDNNKMEQAKDAARRAARQVSQTTEIAVLNFDGDCNTGAVKEASGFTTDLNKLLTAIDALKPGGGTPMYISTGYAVDYAKRNSSSAQRTVILMSDGGDSCRDKQAEAAASIRASNIPVSTIGFDVGTNKEAQADLGNLSKITGGGSFSASAADPKEIIRAFNLAMLPSLMKGADATGVPANVGGMFMQAKSMVQQQNVTGALNLMQQANQLAPNSPNLNFNLSLLYESQDQLIPAMNAANNYLKLAPGAVDRADVENRLAQIQAELQKNPRTVMDSSGCREVLTWAQAEQDAARRGRDTARRTAVLEVLIAAQRGDCATAQSSQAAYKQRYQ